MMRTMLVFLLHAMLVIFLVPSPDAHAQALPPDFKFSITVGGSAPWAEKTVVTIDSAGHAEYARYTTAGMPVILAESSFTVNTADLGKLWKALQDSSFFTLSSKRDSTVQDGEFEKITVTANAQSHEVIVTNAAEPKLEGILTVLNQIIPPALQLSYTPPGSLNILPIDPCGISPSGLRLRWQQVDYSLLRRSTDRKARRWLDTRTASVAGTTFVSGTRSIAGASSVKADMDIPHPGTVVAYNMPIEDAIKKKLATLSSKGEFFGDDVSITVNNTATPPSNTISITLYLEFYGPQATQANIDKIEFDIAKKWSGMKTSSGKTIDLGFVTRSNLTATSPPATPGFHEIKLVPKGAARSNVTGGPKANEGTGGGTWALGEDPGTYGHEAGHLMGLPDRYTDYNKQADGQWVNAKTGQSYANDAAFANYAATKYPGTDPVALKNALKSISTYSVPLDGSENDLMANVSKPPRQSDIDQIAGNPGVLVTVPPGTVLVNRSGNDQNLVVTRRDDLFVKPGETRTQNGIYAACVDHNRGIPARNVLFDIAPPLSTWNGIAAAAHMDKLARYIDSAGLYCGDALAAQEAIWRISDNSVGLFSSSVDEILLAAGITIGDQLMDFPHMTPGPSRDSSSQTLIPNELFVADIHPRFAAGQLATPVTFTAAVSVPTVAPAMPSYAWTAAGPDNAPVVVTAADSTGTLTPQKSGVYEVALKFSFIDSLYGQRAFGSDRKAYVIVPDENTETFEHMSLTDKVPWTSMGDVPWMISNANAQTGSFCAQAGAISSGQQSTLAITVSLPADSAIRFSVRTAIAGFGTLGFSIDSNFTDAYSGFSDWNVFRYPLDAGTHLLTWTYDGSETGAPSNAWLDNIFFPGDVVVTSAPERSTAIPRSFVLEQNYPNPFNPSTVIRYGLPHRATVSLSVFNTLGQKAAELVQGVQEAGYHEAVFDGSKLSSGVYFYMLRADAFLETRKLLLVK